jgi:hypothetical protein
VGVQLLQSGLYGRYEFGRSSAPALRLPFPLVAPGFSLWRVDHDHSPSLENPEAVP